MSSPKTALNPEMRVTSFDQVSSWLIALCGGLGLAVVLLTITWFSMQPSRVRAPIPVEMIELPGGVEDGAIEETLRLEADAPENEQAAPAEEVSDQPEIEEALDSVMDLADQATQQSERQFETQTRNAGVAGSASGTGKRALGMGPGKAGIAREQRWYVSYNDRETLVEYGQQLDGFGIEIGWLSPDGKLTYLSKLGAAKPTARVSTSGKDEQRLYMTWQGGARRKADLQLFQKAGIDASQGTLMHFYPPAVENTLAQLELAFRQRKLPEIKRTYFSTRATEAPGQYEFFVTQQAYFR